ncbi:MAG: helix-turn-helix domain-containing protein [Candidatus Bathyarchaeia archaeon]
MIQEDEYVQILTRLGLTFLQAKTYLALAKLGKADVKTISKASKIARQDIYRIMPALQNMGLVEKIVASPTLYKVTPVNESLGVLLENKTREFMELQIKMKYMLNNFKEKADEVASQEEEQFSIISSRRLLQKKLSEKDRTAQKSIVAIGNWKTIRATFFNRCEDVMNALRKGVKLRIITEIHEKDKQVEKIIQTFMKYPSFEIKYSSTPIPVNAVIHDEKEINMCIATLPDNEVPSLCSTNPRFIKMIVAYFEELWNNVPRSFVASANKGLKPVRQKTPKSLSNSLEAF